MWVTLTPQTRPPARLLSAVLEEQQAAVEAKGYRASECGVLLSQMSAGVRTQHIEKMLQGERDLLLSYCCCCCCDLRCAMLLRLEGPVGAALAGRSQRAGSVRRTGCW